MRFGDYQKRALETAVYPGQGTLQGLLYAALGLGETGEVQGAVKKILRDDGGEISSAKREQLKKEIGDVLWYCAAMAQELGLDLNEIALANLEKLASRKHRGKLAGSGDNR